MFLYISWFAEATAEVLFISVLILNGVKWQILAQKRDENADNEDEADKDKARDEHHYDVRTVVARRVKGTKWSARSGERLLQ